MSDSKGVVLVTGATGQQGGAVMRHLLRANQIRFVGTALAVLDTRGR